MRSAKPRLRTAVTRLLTFAFIVSLGEGRSFEYLFVNHICLYRQIFPGKHNDFLPRKLFDEQYEALHRTPLTRPYPTFSLSYWPRSFSSPQVLCCSDACLHSRGRAQIKNRICSQEVEQGNSVDKCGYT